MEKPKKEQLIDMVSKLCNLRPPDLDAHCIPREYLTRLYRQGSLEKLGRGLWSRPLWESPSPGQGHRRCRGEVASP
jgi:hypothetical protein